MHLTGPSVTVVVLNTNRRSDTLACLDALAQCTYPNRHVIVLDNASTDGSVEAIRSQFPDVQIEHLTNNKGYAGNNNVGIALAMAQCADWILVLNEDTIISPASVAELVAAGERRNTIGIVGPMVYHYDEKSIIQSAGGRIDRLWGASHIGQNEIDSGQFKSETQVDWISGCAIMVRRAVIEQIGGLDERFYYYWEETDWCLRARRAGWEVVHVPQAKIWHKGVQRDYRPGPSITYYNTRNRFLLLSKHQAPLRVWVHAWFKTLKTMTSWSLRPKWRSQRDHRAAMWRGSVDFLRQNWGRYSH